MNEAAVEEDASGSRAPRRAAPRYTDQVTPLSVYLDRSPRRRPDRSARAFSHIPPARAGTLTRA
jgi:hypothetical protein